MTPENQSKAEELELQSTAREDAESSDDAAPEDESASAGAERKMVRETAAKIVADLRHRFTYHTPRPGQPELYEELREFALGFALRLATACPVSRELSLAWTHLETTVFWANAAIARGPAPRAPRAEPLEDLATHAYHDPAGLTAAPGCVQCGEARDHPIHRTLNLAGHRFRFHTGPGPGCSDCGLLADDPVHLQAVDLEPMPPPEARP